MRYVLFLVTSILVFSGCFVNRKKYFAKEKVKVKNCINQWVYEDLQKEYLIRVLLFSEKYRGDLIFSPNFVIGTTLEKDTIAILDSDYNHILEKGDLIKIVPRKWDDDEKDYKRLALTVFLDPRENDLQCKIKTIYYGKIEE